MKISRWRGEAGTGLIGSAAGVAAFVLFLLFAVQLIVNLYATSTVTAAGYDAARSVASANVDHSDPQSVAVAQREAERHLRDLLGDMGQSAQLSWSTDGNQIRLHVVVDSPGILPSSVRDTTSLRHIDRTFVVRIEEPR
ncbi:MAG: hypothetical protein ABI239_13225 [Aquihabitans sp.]